MPSALFIVVPVVVLFRHASIVLRDEALIAVAVVAVEVSVSSTLFIIVSVLVFGHAGTLFFAIPVVTMAVIAMRFPVFAASGRIRGVVRLRGLGSGLLRISISAGAEEEKGEGRDQNISCEEFHESSPLDSWLKELGCPSVICAIVLQQKTCCIKWALCSCSTPGVFQNFPPCCVSFSVLLRGQSPGVVRGGLSTVWRLLSS